MTMKMASITKQHTKMRAFNHDVEELESLSL